MVVGETVGGHHDIAKVEKMRGVCREFVAVIKARHGVVHDHTVDRAGVGVTRGGYFDLVPQLLEFGCKRQAEFAVGSYEDLQRALLG